MTANPPSPPLEFMHVCVCVCVCAYAKTVVSKKRRTEKFIQLGYVEKYGIGRGGCGGGEERRGERRRNDRTKNAWKKNLNAKPEETIVGSF